MKIGLVVGTEPPIYLVSEGQPGIGDTVVLPGTDGGAERKVVITTLHPAWKMDDDGALVPTYEANLLE